ncbi:hypothetical protein [Photobacterium sp.]|uniref:hypothetical protein n=1 Tax=Photobacterium sp. TaxID=660 RepID=UPI00299E3CC1|nr:hypothetical protein [Photobacterium sp.]MDX1301920.1 hypothetical protein [Photobacterium sp.]
MKRIILIMLTMFVVAGCGGSSGDTELDLTLSSSDTEPGAGSDPVPISVDVVVPPTEVPAQDELQACIAIDAISVTDLAGTVTEWTTRSMNDPEGINNNSQQCIPADSEIPIDSDGYPKFIVIDLHDLTGIDIVQLLTEQLVTAGEYTSMSLSILQGSYGDFYDTPYCHIGNLVDKHKMEIADELTFDGLNINIDVPTTYTMSFDLKSMLQLRENVYYLENEGFSLVDNSLAGIIYGDVDPATCENSENAYVYLYHIDGSGYGDLGSINAPVKTAKVINDKYSMKYVPEGTYDVVLACNAIADLPNQVDLDIDLDEESTHEDQFVHGGEEYYKAF